MIPFLFVYSGTLLLKGDPVFIALDFVTAVAGVWFISAAVMGYSLRMLGFWDRALYGIAGISLLLPWASFPTARHFNIVGALMAVALLSREFVLRRRLSSAS